MKIFKISLNLYNVFKNTVTFSIYLKCSTFYTQNLKINKIFSNFLKDFFFQNF